jgi:hypothetical protein
MHLSKSFKNTTGNNFDRDSSTITSPLPSFKLPKIHQARFPGRLFYFNSSLPESDYKSKLGNLTTGPVDDYGNRICSVKVFTVDIYLCINFNPILVR